jgi:hypothetical protein
VLPWFYPTLEAEGILYSSSVYPGKTFLYGMPDFPVHAARPVVGGTQSRVLEWPVPVFSVPGRRIGFSGGFFLRLFPVWFIKAMIRRRNRAGRPVFLYFHPRELDPDGPRLKLRAKERFIHYYGINRAGSKLQQIIRGLPGRFARIKDILHCPSGNQKFPDGQ